MPHKPAFITWRPEFPDNADTPTHTHTHTPLAIINELNAHATKFGRSCVHYPQSNLHGLEMTHSPKWPNKYFKSSPINTDDRHSRTHNDASCTHTTLNQSNIPSSSCPSLSEFSLFQ